MLLPVGSSMRYSRNFAGARPGGGIKTISIPVAQTVAAPMELSAKSDVQTTEEIEDSGVAPLDETSNTAELTEEERKARKAAAAREKRKRKQQARKAAQATASPLSAEAEAELEAEEDDVSLPVHMTDNVDDQLPAMPSSPLHIAANLTDSGTASSDGKASGVSTPASSHGFAAPQQALDWAALEQDDEILAPKMEEGHKSSLSIDRSERASYTDKLANDPTFTPRVGRFWSHDERGMEARWKGRSSPAPGDRSASPYTNSSDGGWQEVTKHQPRSARVNLGGNKIVAPKTSWGKGNYNASGTSSGMRAWADEDELETTPVRIERPPQSFTPTSSNVDFAGRPPEPPWTARSPVPYLFNAPGSRFFIEDTTKKRIMQLRIHINTRSGRPSPRTFERNLTLTSRPPAQSHPHPLAAHAESIVIRLTAGGFIAVSHPAVERKRRAEDQLARAAKEAADEAEEEKAKMEAERRAIIESEIRAAQAAQIAAEQMERERVEEEQRRLQAARDMLIAAMPAPLPEEESEAYQPVASTSSLQESSPVSVPAPRMSSPSTQDAAAVSDAFSGGPPPHMQPVNMFPPGPFVFAEGMGPPGLHIFDHGLGMVVPIDPAVAAQLFPPVPMMENGRPGGSPSDFYPPAGPPQATVQQPAFFAPARSSKVEIKAPTPGQPPARSLRRPPSSSLRNASHSPSASRHDVTVTPPIESIEEHVIPGSYTAGGAVYFSPPPQNGFYYPAPGQGDYYGSLPLSSTLEGRPPDFVDPAILSLGNASTPVAA